jgi:hypothetical protein
MLLCVPNAQHVASLVTQAWAKLHGRSVVTLVPAAAQATPVREPLAQPAAAVPVAARSAGEPTSRAAGALLPSH